MTNEELVGRIRNCECKKENLEQLYLQNKGFIAQIARKYSGYAEVDDLMQEGFIGLCTACELWDECKGANFLTYASHCIRAHIHRYVQQQRSSMHFSEYWLEMIHKYEKLVNEFIQNTSKSPSDSQIMLCLGISQEQLTQLQKDAEKLKIRSLDEPLSEEDDCLSLGDTIADSCNHIADIEDKIQWQQLSKELWAIVDELNPEQSAVIHERYENDLTVKATAAKLNTSMSKVKTHESKAMRELRKSKNTRRLQSYYSGDSYMFSISMRSAGLQTFINTWTSAPEKYVLMAEERNL